MGEGQGRGNGTGLRALRGIGKSLERDLLDLGIRGPGELRGGDPQALYDRLCALKGPQDRCVLYVFRCAVYQASDPDPDPALCDWWRWKDGGEALRR